MKYVLEYNKSISFILILFVIFLHGFLRFSEMPYAKLVLPTYFWEASINLAAGKGFSDPGFSDPKVLNQSPELSKFINSLKLSALHEGDKLSFSNTFYDFTDYQANPVKKIELKDSIGYRYVLGLIWKTFGYNWLFVAIFNYVLSLLALLSLMYCSYRVLGASYSIAIGLIYALSLTEIYYVVALGRDGIPLWFASYLICALIMLFNKPLSFKRITVYSLFIGTIVFASIQGRVSSIYFLPLIVIVYFLLFVFYQKERIEFIYTNALKNKFLEKFVFFFYASLLTVFAALLLNALTNNILLSAVESSNACMMHVVFLGLGIWGVEPTCPSPLLYLDENTYYLAQEYGSRVLGYGTLPYLSGQYQDVLLKLYISIIESYPYFFFSKVLFGSFYKTLLFLGNPVMQSFLDSYPLKFVGAYLTPTSEKPYLAICAAIGSLILYFRLNQKKAAIILLSFILFNAGVSFLQYNVRHVLMAHPAYYFLAGVTFMYVFTTLSNILVFLFTQYPYPQKGLKPISHLTGIHQIPKRTVIISFILVVGLYGLARFSNDEIKTMERKNIFRTQTYFESLEKHPLEVDLEKNKIRFPESLLHKTIGIYCDLGSVHSPQPVNIQIYVREPLFILEQKYIQNRIYNKNLTPVEGSHVILFVPFYYINETASVEISNLKMCNSLKWSDLKDWKGPLWEGTYDRDLINMGR